MNMTMMNQDKITSLDGYTTLIYKPYTINSHLIDKYLTELNELLVLNNQPIAKIEIAIGKSDNRYKIKLQNNDTIFRFRNEISDRELDTVIENEVLLLLERAIASWQLPETKNSIRDEDIIEFVTRSIVLELLLELKDKKTTTYRGADHLRKFTHYEEDLFLIEQATINKIIQKHLELFGYKIDEHSIISEISYEDSLIS